MNLIEFRSVTKTYRKHFWTPLSCAVDAVSFAVKPNQIVGFVGPNGAGKTTSIKMLLGLVRLTSGSILINGISAAEPRARKEIAYLSEQPCFYEHLTVRESLDFAYRLLRLPSAGLRAETDRVLGIVELTEAADKRVKEMSKGMQQRLNMAQALLGNPRTFVLDEPMSGMDPLGRGLFRRIFRQLASEGKSIFFSTHIIEDIESLCDSIIVLSMGKLAYEGSIAQIVDKGFLGTDITVPALDAPVKELLTTSGHEVSAPYPGQNVVFVAAGKDPRACLVALYEKGVVPISVAKRSRALETLLYGGGK